MNNPIRKLSTALANKIAAGEVVERPASVVKELIENSIDAGATHIKISIAKSGLPRIQVTDDGQGIAKTDLLLAIVSHATSKIQSVDDLTYITSLGFRGEALASITAVSHFEIQSRTAQSETGYTISDRHKSTINSIAHPIGTTISISDLFYNIPARRKFLRSDKTEFNHIEAVVLRNALSRFDIGFTLEHDNRTVWKLPIANSLIEKEKRIAMLLGKSFLAHCFHLDIERAPLHLSGWVATPEVARSQNDHQYSFLNGRVIRDKLINHAIRQAYADTLPAGRYPSVILFLQCDPGMVDVNVHPTKHEVRFHDSRLVHDFIVRSVQDVLTHASQSEDMQHDSELLSQGDANKIIDSYQRATWRQQSSQKSVTMPTHSPIAKSVEVAKTTSETEHVLGTFHARYLFIEHENDLMVLDAKQMYAAWVKQRLTKKVADHTVQTQPLLVPMRYPLPDRRVAIWAAHQATFAQIGIQADELDRNILAIRYIPVLLSQVDIRLLLDRIFHILAKNKTPSPFPALITLLADMAAEQLCQQAFTEADIQRLMERSAELPDPDCYQYCLTIDMIDSWFNKRDTS